MRKLAAVAWSALMIAGLAAGCAGQPKTPITPVTGAANEPKWVSLHSAAFPDDRGKALYGVGSAQNMRYPGDKFMLSKVATERARAEVGAQLGALAAMVFKEYQKTAFAPGLKPAEAESLTDTLQRSFTLDYLADAAEKDTWKSPEGDYWVLVKLGMSGAAALIREKIIQFEKGKLNGDPETAHKELDQLIEQVRKQLLKPPAKPSAPAG